MRFPLVLFPSPSFEAVYYYFFAEGWLLLDIGLFVLFLWLNCDVPRLPSYGICILQLVRFARCCTSVLDFHSKNLQITSKLLTQGYRYQKLRKTLGKFFWSNSRTSVEISWYFVPRIFVKMNLSPGLLGWSSLQAKEGQRHTEYHLVVFENSQTPLVWPIDHREDYRYYAWSFDRLVQAVPKALHSF